MVKPKLPSVRPIMHSGPTATTASLRDGISEMKRAAYLYLGLEPGGDREQSGLDFDITEFLAVGDWSSPYVTSPWRKALMGMEWNDTNGGSHASEQ